MVLWENSLSPRYANSIITKAAKIYGGAIKQLDAAVLNPMPSLRMMGKKYAIAYVIVVLFWMISTLLVLIRGLKMVDWGIGAGGGGVLTLA